MVDDAIDLVRSLLRQALIATVWEIVLSNLGRITLMACTLGRYPRGVALERHADRIAVAGFAVLLAAWGAIALCRPLP